MSVDSWRPFRWNAGNYTSCTTAAALGDPGAPLGAGAGKVAITGTGQDAYVITATSKAKGTGGANKTFLITKSTTAGTVKSGGAGATW